jgi:hypothetical protein
MFYNYVMQIHKHSILSEDHSSDNESETEHYNTWTIEKKIINSLNIF